MIWLCSYQLIVSFNLFVLNIEMWTNFLKLTHYFTPISCFNWKILLLVKIQGFMENFQKWYIFWYEYVMGQIFFVHLPVLNADVWYCFEFGHLCRQSPWILDLVSGRLDDCLDVRLWKWWSASIVHVFKQLIMSW